MYVSRKVVVLEISKNKGKETRDFTPGKPKKVH